VNKQKKTKKRGRIGTGRKFRTAPHVRAKVIARKIAGESYREIAAAEKISKNTVTRIMGSQEAAFLLQGFRDRVLGIVPLALKGLEKLVRRLDRQAIIETLYGTRVLMQRYEVQKVQDEPERTYDYTRAEFFGKFGRLPLNSELEEFEKTLNIEPITKAGLIEP